MSEGVSGYQEALAGSLVLVMHHISKPVEMVCDASVTGIGATLLQRGRPVACKSRKLNLAQRNGTAGEHELLAVVHAMRTRRC